MAGETGDYPVVSVKEGYKAREKGGYRFTLRIPSFEVWPGEFIVIVGESGCGKSTLLDLLALILKPQRVETFRMWFPTTARSYDLTSLSEEEQAYIRKAHIGYVLQTGGLLPFLTVRENILLPCYINGMTEMEEAFKELVRYLAIEDHVAKKPQFLSGGQRQRVAIARALIHSPSLVLADEPTAAVDSSTAKDICHIFKKLTQELDITLCMVTHHESLVADVADRTFYFELQTEKTSTQAICCERGF